MKKSKNWTSRACHEIIDKTCKHDEHYIQFIPTSKVSCAKSR